MIPYTPSEELAFPIGYMDRLLPDIAVKDTETDLVVKVWKIYKYEKMHPIMTKDISFTTKLCI